MKKPELDSTSSSAVSKQPAWLWPYYCHHRPRTLSFRVPGHVLDTIDSSVAILGLSSESAVASSTSSPPPSASPANRDMSLESVIQSARSERLFFDLGATSSSILDEAASSPRPRLPHPVMEHSSEDEETGVPESMPYNDSVFLSVDSRDPLLDFHESMTEMVAAHGIVTWDGLVELLWWYLKVNDESNHSYIYGAFIDLTFGQVAFSDEHNSSSSEETRPAGGPSCAPHYSPTTPLLFDALSSTSAASSSSSSSIMRCVSGVGMDDLDKEQ